MSTSTKLITKLIPGCLVCGKKSTDTNALNLPSCKDHIALPTAIPICPVCDAKMIIKQGKHGGFWSCPDYPTCFGTRGLVDPNAEPDIL